MWVYTCSLCGCVAYVCMCWKVGVVLYKMLFLFTLINTSMFPARPHILESELYITDEILVQIYIAKSSLYSILYTF